MAGPNQTGSTLQAPVSNALGYGDALNQQVEDEEEKRRKKAEQDASTGVQPTAQLSRMLGY